MADLINFRSAIFFMREYILFILILIFQAGNCQDQTLGLFLNSENAYNGYTLFSNNETTYLIDNCGKEIHSWQSDFRAGQAVYLLENGDLLRAGEINNNFNGGGSGGIIELFDWEGNLKWQYKISDEFRNTHHDLEPLPNGNFLCTLWEKKSEEEAKNKGRKFDGEVWSESIYEIEILPNNEANIVWEWSVWDHLIQDFDDTKPNYGVVSEHPELININYIGINESTSGDWLHINAIDYNAEFDQIAISARHISEVYVIDHSTTTEEASGHLGGNAGKGGDILFRYGNPQVYNTGNTASQILWKQHNVEWCTFDGEENVAFSVYNNDYIIGQQSNVILFNNPIDKKGRYNYEEVTGYGNTETVRSYTDENLYSRILSGVQVLPNENLLITEGSTGHITEVDKENNLVWEYINPVNRNGGPGIQGASMIFNSLFRAKRYPLDYPAFQNRDLTPGEPIELSPDPYECNIYDNTVSNKIPINNDKIELVSNPVYEVLKINSEAEYKDYKIINAQGSTIIKMDLKSGINDIDVSELSAGIYFVVSRNMAVKFIKI